MRRLDARALVRPACLVVWCAACAADAAVPQEDATADEAASQTPPPRDR